MEHCRQTLTLNLARASGIFPPTSFCPRHSPSGRETERKLKPKRGTGEENRSNESEAEKRKGMVKWRTVPHEASLHIQRHQSKKTMMEQSYHPRPRVRPCPAATHHCVLLQLTGSISGKTATMCLPSISPAFLKMYRERGSPCCAPEAGRKRLENTGSRLLWPLH